MSYHIRKTDANQTEVVDALRKAGASVAITSSLGNGFPDIVISIPDVNILIEIKDGKKPPAKQRLSEHEQKFHDNWQGPIHIVKSVDEALELIKKYKQEKAKCQCV